jgi:predicted acetyltransferase
MFPPTDPALRLATLDTFDDAELALAAYVRSDSIAFGESFDPTEVAVKAGVVDPTRYVVACSDGDIVGGAGSHLLELTLPGCTGVAAAAVSDVGVAPTHRRRGILTSLMGHQLGAMLDEGTPVALLHASEAGIYRRFGFGPATGWRQLRVDARRVSFLDGLPAAEGSMQVLQRADALQPCAQVHDRVRRAVPGGLSRPASWWPVVLGDTDVYLGGTKDHLVLVHRDGAGAPDGYAIYVVHQDWSHGQANHELAVWELVGSDPTVELALWRTLIEHDLVASVSGPIAVDHPLFDVAADPRQVGIAWEQDLLWVRPLDVPALLSTRRYRTAGRLVLQVDDELRPEVGGTFELSVDGDGVGECRRSDDDAQVHLGVSELGSLLLGRPGWRRLSRAGRLSGAPGALSLADEMFGTDPLPWCWVRF